jgi:MFS family permease
MSVHGRKMGLLTKELAVTKEPTPVRLSGLMTALLSACVAFQLNASMLSPVLPTMATELGASDVSIGMSQTAFFTSAAMFAIVVPRLSDIVGRRRILGVTLVVVAAGSVLAAVAPDVAVLSLARIVQGCSGAVIAICLLMLRTSVADVRRYGALMGVIAAVNGGVAGIDVLLGGFLASHFGFRPVFWLMAAVAVVAAVLVRWQATESRPSAHLRIDWQGATALVISLVSFLLALNEAGKLGAARWSVVAALCILGVAAFAGFYCLERIVRDPLVRTVHLRGRQTWALLLTTVLTLMGVFAAINGLAVSFAQNTHVGFGLSASATSVLILAPYALVGWAVGPFAGRWAPRVGYRRVLRLGLAGSIIAMCLMATLGLHSLPALVTAAVLLGIAYAGMANIMLNGLGVVLAPPDNPGFLPGINTGAFNIGAGLSFAVLPIVQVASAHAGTATIDGYVYGIGLGAVIMAAALASSYLIPRPATAEVATSHSLRRKEALHGS